MNINDKSKCKIHDEYQKALPKLQKIESLLISKVEWHLRSLKFHLKEYQRIEVESRIKSYDSSLEKLEEKYRAPGLECSNKMTYSIKGNDLSLDKLPDLVGVRILVFPSNKLSSIHKIILKEFNWDLDTNFFAFGSQFQGRLKENTSIGCEIQIIPLLIGKFWEVEHFVLYKPHSSCRRVKNDTEINDLSSTITNSLEKFQERFCYLLKKLRSPK